MCIATRRLLFDLIPWSHVSPSHERRSDNECHVGVRAVASASVVEKGA